MQISSTPGTPAPAPQQRPIERVPAWARAEVDSFQATGHLAGDNVARQPIPAGQAQEVESQLTSQLQQLISAAETPLDQARNEPGTVKISQMGLDATAWFLGDTATGAMAFESGGAMTSAAYAEFSPACANIVQILDLGGGEEKPTVAAHIDRQNPANSYLELKNVPEGMVPF